MTGSLRSHVEVAVAPDLPAVLVPAQSLAAIRRLADEIPAGLTTFFGLECRLWDEAPGADFLLHVSPEHGRDVLAGLGRDEGLAYRWPSLSTFAARWAEPGTALHQHITGAWLEFDLAAGRDGDMPSIFFGSDGLTAAAHGQQEAEWLTRDALVCLLDPAQAEALRNPVGRLLGRLPAAAHVFQVGAMLSRPAAAIRVCVRGLAAPDIVPWLLDVGWAGDPHALGAVVADAAAHADSIDVDVDLGIGGIAAKVGLECSCLQGPTSQAHQAGLLAHLVHTGLCTAAKAVALGAWQRGFHERADPYRWPADLSRRARELGDGTVSMFLRWLYHVKIVYEPDRPLLAKAYLAVRQCWPSARTIGPMLAARGDHLAGTASTKSE